MSKVKSRVIEMYAHDSFYWTKRRLDSLPSLEYFFRLQRMRDSSPAKDYRSITLDQ